MRGLAMPESYRLFIDGWWRDAADRSTMPAINPYNKEVHAHIPVATAGDVEEAVAASPSRLAIASTSAWCS